MIDSLDILTNEDYVEHYGILGMHWGIRRTPEQLGHKISRKKEKFEKYADKAAKAADKGNLKAFNKYSKKTEKTANRVVKLNKTLEKALRRQNEHDEKIISRGSLEEVIAISDRLTQEQINRAYNRISSKQKLEGLRPSVTSAVDKAVSLGGKVAEGAKAAYNIADYANKFRTVMKDVKQAEIKEVEEAREKARKKEVKKAIQTGQVSEFKKVFEKANLEELKDMSDTLKMRYEIENMNYGELEKNLYKATLWQNRQYANKGGGGGNQKK